MASILHTLGDGSVLRIVMASDIVKIPVWKGNRIIDPVHVENIRTTVGANVRSLDFGYRLVTYEITDGGGAISSETVLVDGQHRHAVLCEHFRPPYFGEDFPVVVTEKHVESEIDIIEYFNTLNNVKAMTWSEPKLIANAYIAALESEFNKGIRPKSFLIRKGATHRPYLSADKVREGLEKITGLRGGKADIATFVARVKAWNDEQLRLAEVSIAYGGKNAEMIGKAAGMKFMLALDPKLPWLSQTSTLTYK
jgi:hypothetical protein